MMPARIVCLSAESADILIQIGAGKQIVGATAYARLPRSLHAVPRVSGFSGANIKRIVGLKPDLAIGYSDVQANIALQLIRAGVSVLMTQQTSLAEIADTIRFLGRIVGRDKQAERLVIDFQSRIAKRKSTGKPRVYFEEWPEPMICGIGWVSELIELAGGEDIFRDRRGCRHAADRVVQTEEVVRRDPEVIIASWCGRRANTVAMRKRTGWSGITAVKNTRVFEIDSDIILQPGPAVAEGFREICRILREL